VGAGDYVFISGQIPLAPDGKIVGYTPKDQARKALENLRTTLGAAGLTLGHVVKTTIFLKDMDEFAAVNDVYAEFFEEPYPARSTVEVARLPKDLHVEIEAIAYRG
jgi:2-iminobutanoate/2-iminopropanoate deaminase